MSARPMLIPVMPVQQIPVQPGMHLNHMPHQQIPVGNVTGPVGQVRQMQHVAQNGWSQNNTIPVVRNNQHNDFLNNGINKQQNYNDNPQHQQHQQHQQQFS